MLAGLMATETKPLGLSLGDRACLAVGLAYDLPVITADRNWTSLKTDVRVNTLR
jgi:ribonuclease VapC